MRMLPCILVAWTTVISAGATISCRNSWRTLAVPALVARTTAEDLVQIPPQISNKSGSDDFRLYQEPAGIRALLGPPAFHDERDAQGVQSIADRYQYLYSYHSEYGAEHDGRETRRFIVLVATDVVRFSVPEEF